MASRGVSLLRVACFVVASELIWWDSAGGPLALAAMPSERDVVARRQLGRNQLIPRGHRHQATQKSPQRAKQKMGKDPQADLLVHGARDDFMAILRVRKQVEMEAAMPQPFIRQVNLQGVQDVAALTELLKIPVDRRTHAGPNEMLP